MDRESILEAYRNRWTLFLYYGLRALILIAATVFAYEKDWSSAAATVFVFLLTWVPSILKYRYRFYLPFALDLAIVAFIFTTLFLGHLTNFYENVPLWDKFLHFQSGLILGVSGFVLVYTLNKQGSFHLHLSPGFVAFFAITFSLAFGAVWEVVEFTAGSLFNVSWQNGNTDTMWDLVADATGALIVSIYGYLWMRREARLPFTPRFFSFIRDIREKGRQAARSLARK